MDQVRYTRSSFGSTSETLFTFDGVILEIFGLTQVLGVNHPSVRFHRDLMTITIDAPDRKASRNVTIAADGTVQCQFTFGDDDRPVIDFLERVRATIAAA